MKTQVKHTQGPWMVGAVSPSKAYIFAEEERVIARLYDNRGSFPQASLQGNDYIYGGQCEANAQLIAAAPDLLEALKKLSAYGNPEADATVQLPWEDVAEALAAIAKATGGADQTLDFSEQKKAISTKFKRAMTDRERTELTREMEKVLRAERTGGVL